MSAATDEIDFFEEEPTGLAKWFVPGLIISLLLHVIFFMWARNYPFEPFSEAYYEEMVPRTFRVDRVDVDPRLLEPEPAQEAKQAAAPAAVKLPEEKVMAGAMEADIKMTPAAPEIEKPEIAEKVAVDAASFQDAVQTAQQNGAQTVAEDMDALREELIREDPDVSGRPFFNLDAKDGDAGGTPSESGDVAGGATPGFSNLDSLLAQTGPLTNETAPILMPTDLLFDYDSYQVRASAVPSLEKLGVIVQRNPQASFTIEGHTDSFGDDAYNLKLSRERAESIKAWLVQAMNIAPERIQTQGYGKARLIAPAAGSIEEQQINRRVEIVIHTKPGTR